MSAPIIPGTAYGTKIIRRENRESRVASVSSTSAAASATPSWSGATRSTRKIRANGVRKNHPHRCRSRSMRPERVRCGEDVARSAPAVVDVVVMVTSQDGRPGRAEDARPGRRLTRSLGNGEALGLRVRPDVLLEVRQRLLGVDLPLDQRRQLLRPLVVDVGEERRRREALVPGSGIEEDVLVD